MSPRRNPDQVLPLPTRLWFPKMQWSLALLGLCCFTFTVVTYYFPIGELGIALAMLGVLLKSRPLRTPLFLWLFLVLLSWAALGSIYSEYPDQTLDKVVGYIKISAVLFIIVNALNDERRLSFYLYFFVACYILFPVRGTFIGYAQGHHPFGRAVWNNIYSNPNDLAALSLLTLGVALSIATSEKAQKIARLGAVAAAVLLVAVIVITKSRGVFLGGMVVTIPTMVRLVINKPSRLFYIALLAAVVMAFVPSDYFNRLAGVNKLTHIATISEADPEGSAGERWEIQKTAWRIFTDHAFLGVGLGNYPMYNAKYSPQLGARDTHNTYLNLGAELGIPGLLIWCLMVASIFRELRKARLAGRLENLGVNVIWIQRALLGFLLAGLVGTYAGLTFLYLILAVLWSAANVVRSDSGTGNPVPQSLRRR